MIYKSPFWNKKEVARLDKFRQGLYESKFEDVEKRLKSREYNEIQFYNITPKENLPKYLQKMDFKSIHVKEKETEKNVKIFKKQRRTEDEEKVRRCLKEQGNLLYLSEIYSMVGMTTEYEPHLTILNAREEEQIRDLQQWQKVNVDQDKKASQHQTAHTQQHTSHSEQQRKTHQLNIVLMEMRHSKNYCHEVTQSLQTLSKLHADQKNLQTRMMMVESNAVLIKNELDLKKAQIEQKLYAETQQLQQKRKEYHNLFVCMAELEQQEKSHEKQKIHHKEEVKLHSMSFLSNRSIEKKIEQFRQRRHKLQQQLDRLRKDIEKVQKQASVLSEQRKSIEFAQLLFYRLSLKIGIDCRQTGLSWLIIELKKRGDKVSEESLPNYIDKKSKEFLISKTHHQQILEKLIQQKHDFVKIIIDEAKKRIMHTRTSMDHRGHRKSSILLNVGKENRPFSQNEDREDHLGYKVARSTKLLNKINEIKKEGIMMATYAGKNANSLQKFTFQGVKEKNSKRLYDKAIVELRKIDTKQLEHGRCQNQKSLMRSKNLIKYKNLLQKIKQQHILLQEMEIQQENHILLHYKDSKVGLIEQAAACFGIRRAFSMFPKCVGMITTH